MRFGEGSYPDALGKGVRLSPLIDADDEDALRKVIEGIGSGGRAPEPLRSGRSLLQVRRCELILRNSLVRSLQSSGRLKLVLMVSLVSW